MSKTRSLLMLAILPLGLGCGPDLESGFHRHPDPKIAVRTPNLPQVNYGEVAEGTIEIRNRGDGPLVVSSLRIREEGEDHVQEVFTRGQAWNGYHTIKGGESLELSVCYIPVNRLRDQAWFQVDANIFDGNKTFWELPLPNIDADLDIVGVRPDGGLAFDDVRPGSSRTRKVGLKNVGTYPLELSQFQLRPKGRFSFDIVDGDSSSIPPDEFVLLEVTYAATDTSTERANLTFQTNDPNRQRVDIPLVANKSL